MVFCSSGFARRCGGRLLPRVSSMGFACVMLLLLMSFRGAVFGSGAGRLAGYSDLMAASGEAAEEDAAGTSAVSSNCGALSPEPLECGSELSVEGVVSRRGGRVWVETDEGVSYVVLCSSPLGRMRLLAGRRVKVRGLFTLVDHDGELVPAVEEHEPALLALFKGIDFHFFELEPAVHAAPPPPAADLSRRLVFPPAVRMEGERFVALFHRYVSRVSAYLERRYEEYVRKGIVSVPSSLGYALLTRLNREAWQHERKLYDEAVGACDTYLEACRKAGIWDGVEPSSTYLDADKATFLVAVRDKEDGTVLACVPFAYGANPDGGPKVRNGDLRTPEVPPGREDWRRTPFYIGRRARGTVAPGMITRNLGLSSSRREDRFWVKYGMNIAFHGTPAWWSMGLRASHGCCRVLPRHVIVLYDLTTVGTPVIIRGVR